jgi:hypothetical protein
MSDHETDELPAEVIQEEGGKTETVGDKKDDDQIEEGKKEDEEQKEEMINCPQCTFLNKLNSSKCEMCEHTLSNSA